MGNACTQASSETARYDGTGAGSYDQPVTPRVLEHAIGRWIVRPALENDAITAQCPHCDLVQVHDVSARDGAYRDAIAVFANGSVLCKMTRVYTVSSTQEYGGSGEMIDYELAADTCGLGPTGVVHEGYALWEAAAGDFVAPVI